MKQQSINFLNKISNILGENTEIKALDQTSNAIFTLDEFFNHFNPEDIAKGHCHFIFTIVNNGNNIASWELKDLIGCAGILVYTGLFVRVDYRGKKIATEITKFIPELGRYYGYGIIQATDIKKNTYTASIMRNLNWKLNSEFINKKTANVVCLWTYNL